MAADWNAIKTEYITNPNTSYRKLSQKYGISDVQIAKVGKKENWVELRKQHLGKSLAKSLTANSNKIADRFNRIQSATDKLLEKIEIAINELDIHLYEEVHKEKVVEYNDEDRPNKATKETTRETKEIIKVSSIVDRAGLKQIASALRDIKEIHMLKTELDRQEQEARIANLRKQAEKEDDTANVVEVIFAAGPEEWNE